MNMTKLFKNIFLCCFVVGLLLIFTGTSYSLINDINSGAVNNNVSPVKTSVQGSTSISINNPKMLNDAVGLEEPTYNFNLVNEENKKVSYVLYLNDDENVRKNCALPCSFIDSNEIRYSLIKDSIRFNTTNLNSDRIIDSGVIDAKSSISYNIKLWIGTNNTMPGTIFYGKIEVKGIVI